ncbi:DgyrCDS7255 [Dimorphilus gyrociliatus]|uniref:DgyrCDS7255 n=1 Tax=Dimorphilus gyrociliatus TaxID=2664684 RepID=A0A7I8VT54_9ANNE|nr:DgyrCDS7255 [Dimorphilus gyrociliatus]
MASNILAKNTPRFVESVMTASAGDFKSNAIFEKIGEEMGKNGADYVKKIKGIFCFKVKNAKGEQGVWIVDAKNGNGSVKFVNEGKGDVTIAMGDEDMIKMMLGQLNPQQAFFQGKLKITGNMGLAMKMKEFQAQAKAKL